MHIHVGRNVPGCEPDEHPGCFSTAEAATGFFRSLLNTQAGYYSDSCETPCEGVEGCACDACECDWCALSASATDAMRDESVPVKLASGQNVRFKFDHPEGSDEEIWAYCQDSQRSRCEFAETGD